MVRGALRELRPGLRGGRTYLVFAHRTGEVGSFQAGYRGSTLAANGETPRNISAPAAGVPARDRCVAWDPAGEVASTFLMITAVFVLASAGVLFFGRVVRGR